ncbi:MAG TPA: hypothetical protein VK281_00410 [Xanthobacteraceae bacterium]|nr:hypothetical protein [Xanthobacteraceae bacterium]
MVQPIPLRPDTNSAPPGCPPDARPTQPAGKPPAAAGPVPVKPPRLTAEEREFLPAALEVIETPFSPTLRLTAFALCSFIAAAIAWASFAHIDMVAVADGKVVPLGQVKVVQPLGTAMIRAIHVDEADHVAAGQLLVDLDPTEARADLDALRYNRVQAALDVARVLLSRNGAEPFQIPGGADPVLVEQSRDQAQREIEKHLAVVAGYEADIAQKAAALESNDAQIERARLTIPLLEEKQRPPRGSTTSATGRGHRCSRASSSWWKNAPSSRRRRSISTRSRLRPGRSAPSSTRPVPATWPTPPTGAPRR